eukprot:gene6676-3341_t
MSIHTGSINAPRANFAAKAFESSLPTVSVAGSKAFESSLPTVSVAGSKVQDWEGDLLVVGAYEEDFMTESESGYQYGDAEHSGSQSRVVRVGSAPGAKAKYVSLAGLGKSTGAAAEWGPSAWQALGSSVASLAKANKAKSVAIGFLDAPTADASTLVTQVASGALLGGYESNVHKSKKSPTASQLAAINILLPGMAEADATAAVTKAGAIASGTNLTRYLVEAPPNVCTPTHIADSAKHIADKFPEVMKLKVMEKADCEAMGMGCFLGVSEASDEPPKLIHLTYTAPCADGAPPNKKIALVGKGLTFDSGGYNIKAGAGSMIELMKFDMGGSGATMGAARIIAELAPPGVEVHFIVASCENMIGSRGLRPGDILTAASGKTVEVNNTDAEGRLTLADALWYAQEKCGATSIVDTATLTGACIIALGGDIAGLFSPSDAAAAAVVAASKAAGEKVWRMPMEHSYFDQLKSSVADMKNTGARGGGSITAALFLNQFINEGVEWAHVDMAGPVWDDKAALATGWGASTLAMWAIGQGKA